MQKKISVQELVSSIAGTTEVLGKSDRTVTAISPVDKANSNSVTFCNRKGEEGLRMVRNSRAGAIVCYDDLQLLADDLKKKTFILVTDPRSAFIQVMREHFLQEKVDFGIARTAVIEKGAEIHPRVYIGHHCYIGKCKIDEGTIIYGNNYIYPNTEIGKNVIIHAGAIVGAEASGFARNEKKELEKFPQIGGLIIEDDVEIGSNTTICRGAMGNTLIGHGAKIGNLCYIAHGATIGKHCLVLNHSAIGGYCQVGDHTQVSTGACVRNTINIGKNVVVGMGAVVTKHVEDGKIVFGVPAREQGETRE